MCKFIKIILLALLILLVFVAGVADFPSIAAIAPGLHLAFYLRVAALLGLLAAVFMAWGYKRRIETSQKYQSADQVVAEAQAGAQRIVQKAKAMEEKFKHEHQSRTRVIEQRMAALQTEHHRQLKALKTQNIQLKEEVSRLMRILKRKRGNAKIPLTGPEAKP